jgi:hypothetical protein
VHGDYVVPIGTARARVQAFPALVSPALEAFEPPNEPDDQRGQPYPTWVAPCITMQQNLYSWVKGTASLAHYPVFGPGMAWHISIGLIGNVSSSYDYMNIHNYLNNYNPGNPYAAYVLGLARAVDSGKPVVVTETGYGTGTSTPILLDDRTDVRYMTRLFLEFFKLGIARSYSYDFVQIGGSSKFGQFGLVNENLVPKPAYFGVKSLIGALTDPGSYFKPSALGLRLSGFVNNVHHLLMQKRDGSFVLAVWIEAPGWNTTNATGGDVIVQPQTITLQTSANFSRVAMQTMTDGGTFANATIPWSTNKATFNVTDAVSLITLAP